MASDSGGLWPHDPEAGDDNRSVDDLEIPADEEMLPDDNHIAPIEVEDEAENTDEWGDDADNRLVDLDDDDPDDDEGQGR